MLERRELGITNIKWHRYPDSSLNMPATSNTVLFCDVACVDMFHQEHLGL